MKNAEQIITAIPQNALKIDVNLLPKHEIDALCRVLLHSVAEAFKNPDFAAEYEAWRKQRNEKQKEN